MKIVGIILIAVGALMLIFRGMNFSSEKKVVDLGPIEINKKENHRVVWPIYAGGIALIAGVCFVIADKKGK